jgi:two-component system NtrC family sensor kinase
MDQITVLVIEDNIEILNFLRDIVLGSAGYKVVTATDGQEGLERALTVRPDVILLDLQMPHLTGLDLLTLLKKQNSQIPTIVLSAYGSEQAILKAFRLGARDFLSKPFSMDEVKEAIENAIAEERLRWEKEKLTRELAKANQRLRQQIQNWIALNDIAQAITSTVKESEILQRVMTSINQILQVEAGALLLADEENVKLRFAITLEGDAAQFSELSLEPGQGIAGWVAQHGKPVLVPDVSRDPRFYPRIDQVTGFKTRSVLCVPLKSRDRIIGVIEVINKRDRTGEKSFTESDLKVLTMLASWVAVAVENAQLNRATREIAAATALKQTVTTMAHHINNRLMSFSLELDGLESEGRVDQQTFRDLILSARRCIGEISAVIKALDQSGELRTVPYSGGTDMLDIEKALEEQMRRLENIQTT